MCQLDTSSSLIYLHLLTVFFCLFSSFFIIFNSKKDPTSLNIAIFILVLGIWTAFDMLQWVITDISLNLLFGRLTTLVCLMTLFFLYFAYHFTGRELPVKKKLLLALPFLPIALLLFSDYNLTIFDASGCEFAQGQLYYYVYFLALLYTTWAIILLIKKYRSETTLPSIRLQIKILIINIASFILWMVSFAIIENYATLSGDAGLENEVSSFFLLGMMIFIAIIVYVVYKGALLKLTKISKNIFVGVLWATLFLILFVVQPGTIFSIVAFLLYLFLIVIFWII